MNKLKRIISGCLVVVVTLIVATFFLPVKKVQAATNVDTYTELAEELKYPATATVTLTKNITVTGQLVVRGNKTLNGGGYTLTPSTSYDGAVINVQQGGTLTISNITINGASRAENCINGTAGSTINISGGSYKNAVYQGVVSYGKLNITGGSFFSNGTTSGNPGVGYGGFTTCTIKGGNFYNNGSAGFCCHLGKYPTRGYTQTVSISGGSFYSNGSNGLSIGIGSNGTPSSSYNGSVKFTMTGGSCYSNDINGITIYQDVTGTISGSSSAVKLYDNNVGLMITEGTVDVTAASASKFQCYGNKNGGVYVIDNGKFTCTYGNICSLTGHVQKIGVYIANGSTATLGAGTNIYGNSSKGVSNSGTLTSKATISAGIGQPTGIYNGSSGTCTVSGGTIKGCTNYAVENAGVFKMSSGTITGNSCYSVYNNGSSATCTISGGYIYNNSGLNGDVYHSGKAMTITGVYTSGTTTTSSVNGYVYIVGSSRYVTTNTLSVPIKIRPSVYNENQVVIKTTSATYSAKQANSTLYPKEGWYLQTSGSNVVLNDRYLVKFVDWDNTVISSVSYAYGTTISVPSEPTRESDESYIYNFKAWSPTVSATCTKAVTYKATYTSVEFGEAPVIYYGDVVVDGEMYVPGYDEWFNVESINRMKVLSATDVDGNLDTLELYSGTTVSSKNKVVSGTGNGDKMSISYDFCKEGQLVYTLVAIDTQNNKTIRTIIVNVDLTPPILTGAEGTESKYGNTGTTTEGIVSWSTALSSGTLVEQTASDALSGVNKLCVYSFRNQLSVALKTVLDDPFVITCDMNSEVTGQLGVVVKAWDRAGNGAFKFIANEEMLVFKIELTLPRENFN